MLKPLLAIALFFLAFTSKAQTSTNTDSTKTTDSIPAVVTDTMPPIIVDSTQATTEVVDTLDMDLVCCPLINPLAKCKRVKGYGLMKKSAAAISCSNTTGMEVVDMQIYLDDQKKVIDLTKFDVFFR